MLIGIISNNQGRKLGLVVTYLIGLIGVIAIGLIVVNYWITLLFYSIMGFMIPYLNFSSLWLNETGDEGYRNLSNGMIQFVWGLGEIIWVIIGYYVYDWRKLITITVTIPLVCALVGFIWLRETPLYLLSRRKFKEFERVIAYIAHLNKKQLSRSFNHFNKTILS